MSIRIVGRGTAIDQWGRSSEYNTWTQIKARCRNPRHKQYGNYGGRGIRVCDRWLGSQGFLHFFADMGCRPSSHHSIDRIDNDGPYAPENCHWTDDKAQARNKRGNRPVTWQGRTLCLAAWAELMNLKPHTLYMRLFRYGWTVERAMKTPPQPWGR